MWQHKIIEEFETRFSANDHIAKKLINDLKISHCFNMGEYTNLKSMFQKIVIDESPNMFLRGVTLNKLPYNNTVFEHTVQGVKFSLLSEQQDNIIKIRRIICTKDGWTFFDSILYIKLGDSFTDLEISEIKNTTVVKVRHNAVIAFDTLLEEEVNEDVVNDVLTSSLLICMFLMALNCKNVSTKEILPIEKVNKKRIRNGKVPQLSYHILQVKGFNIVRVHGVRTLRTSEYENRLHFCRGHLKVYTKEKPLMGKFTGLYWWQSQIRGRNKDGFVDKDYEVKLQRRIDK